jgi:hypothetical protein
LSNSDQIFGSLEKEAMSYVFGKPLSKAFQNHKTCPPFFGDQKDLVRIKKAIEKHFTAIGLVTKNFVCQKIWQ